MTAVPGYPNLRYSGGAAAKPAEQHVNPSVLQALQTLAARARVVVDIFSGSGGPTVRGAGFAGDPHSSGNAVDGSVNGRPLGSFFTPQAFASVGLVSGDQPNFWRGAPDPNHVQAAGVTGATNLSASATTGANATTGGAFFSRVLRQLKLPDTFGNRVFLAAWAQTGENTAAKYNPLATTLNLPGSTLLPGNTSKVRQYQTAAQGEQATAETLKGYPGIMAALRTGAPVASGLTPQLVHDFTVWSGNTNDPAAGQAYAQRIFRAAQGHANGSKSTAADWLSADLNTKVPAGGALINAATGGAYGRAAGDAKAAVNAIDSVPKLVHKISSRGFLLRAGEVAGGGLMVFAGLLLLARQVGLSAPMPPAAVNPTRVVPSTFAGEPGGGG